MGQLLNVKVYKCRRSFGLQEDMNSLLLGSAAVLSRAGTQSGASGQQILEVHATTTSLMLATDTKTDFATSIGGAAPTETVQPVPAGCRVLSRVPRRRGRVYPRICWFPA